MVYLFYEGKNKGKVNIKKKNKENINTLTVR
jgi:hypothetical protein